MQIHYTKILKMQIITKTKVENLIKTFKVSTTYTLNFQGVEVL